MRKRLAIGIAAATILAVMPAGSSAGEPESGKKVYDAKCLVCHGLDGKGSRRAEQVFKTKIPDFTITDFAKLAAPEKEKREQELRSAVANAEPPMAQFTKALTAAERENVLDYILKTFMKAGSSGS
jgi:mono/diheme cytochrome c family protein